MPTHRRSYRLKQSTLAIIIVDGNHQPTTVPTGAIVKILDGPLDDNRLVDVNWDGKTVMMFTTDIRERGLRLDD